MKGLINIAFHKAICPYCKIQYDRNAERFVMINKQRAAHERCAIEHNRKENLPPPIVIDPTIGEHVCDICRTKISLDEESQNLRQDIYVHTKCLSAYNTEASDREKLELFVANLFNMNWCGISNLKMIDKFINQYHYTPDGIIKALTYFYAIQKNDVSRANARIGIVPYVYDEAQKYYDNIAKAQKSNEGVIASEKKEIKVQIQKPVRVNRKRQSFRFLDEDEE